MPSVSLLPISCLLLVALAASGALSCWAPPFVNGRACSGTSIFGSTNHRVRYTITGSGNAGSLLCCEAFGCPLRSRSCSRFSWVGIGCGHGSFSGDVFWGNNVAQTKVRCKGTPFGMGYRFTT